LTRDSPEVQMKNRFTFLGAHLQSTVVHQSAPLQWMSASLSMPAPGVNHASRRNGFIRGRLSAARLAYETQRFTRPNGKTRPAHGTANSSNNARRGRVPLRSMAFYRVPRSGRYFILNTIWVGLTKLSAMAMSAIVMRK